MGQSSGTNSDREPPRERNKRRCYVELAPKLLESEPVEMEREFPAEDNSPIERIEPHILPLSPLIEDWGAP
jgi:hypothetical protein